MAKEKMKLVILVSKEAVAALKKQKIGAKNYNKVVMALMKNADFQLKMLGDTDIDSFQPFSLNALDEATTEELADVEALDDGTEDDVAEIQEAKPKETQLEKLAKKTIWRNSR
jgi:hypothetical protein